MPFVAFAMRGESQAHEYAPVLGRYHNFMVPFGFGFHKLIYKRVQFSLHPFLNFYLGQGYQHFKKFNWFSQCWFLEI